MWTLTFIHQNKKNPIPRKQNSHKKNKPRAKLQWLLLHRAAATTFYAFTFARLNNIRRRLRHFGVISFFLCARARVFDFAFFPFILKNLFYTIAPRTERARIKNIATFQIYIYIKINRQVVKICMRAKLQTHTHTQRR